MTMTAQQYATAWPASVGGGQDKTAAEFGLRERLPFFFFFPSTFKTILAKKMALELLHLPTFLSSSLRSPSPSPKISTSQTLTLRSPSFLTLRRRSLLPRSRSFTVSASLPTLDLTEDNIRNVLIDAKSELAQIFDASVGITGRVDLAELDGPYVKLRLKGRFWHTRATVLARVGNYLKNRIPEILEVDIEDDEQLDDSPANF